MNKLLAILSLASLAVQAAPRAGISLSRYPIHEEVKNSGKIFDGTQVADSSELHQVLIVMDNSYYCGGSIIKANKILAAAQCVDGFRTFSITAGDTSSGNGQTRTAISTDVVIHPDWNPSVLRNDLAVITLSQPFELGEWVNTIGLEGYTQEPNNHAGEMTTISNYGGSKVENVTVITNEVCASSYGQIGANPGVICIAFKNGDPCSFGMGSPLTLTSKPDELIGFANFGYSSSCGMAPSGCTRVAYYRDWIDLQL